jgi:hypothetical protein
MHIPEVVGKAAMITGRTCRLLPPPEYAAKALIKAWSTFRCRQMTSITDEMALTAWWGSDALQTLCTPVCRQRRRRRVVMAGVPNVKENIVRIYRTTSPS